MGIVARIMEQAGDRIAVETGGIRISYARLLADMDSAAQRLAEAGVGEGKIAGIRAGTADNGHSYANWVAHLAVMKLGAQHLSVTDVASIRAALRASRLDCIIGPFDQLVDVPREIRRIEFLVDPRAASAPVPDVKNREQDARRLNLTSGTTGRAKLLAWNSAMIEMRVDQIASSDLVNAETRLFPLLHLRTTAGFRYPLATWAAGGCVILPKARKGIERDQEALPTANLIACSPLQLKERLAAIAGNWPGREGRTIVLMGGRLPEAVRDAAVARACTRLIITYGATETGSIALGDHDVVDRHPGAVGFVRPGAEVEIVGPGGQPVPAGQPGLVRTRSTMMASGYEGVTTGKGAGGFRDGWFYPGDIGRLFNDGLLAIEGRAGDTLNLGGWKVSANDLEAKLGAFPGVQDICAINVPLPEGDTLTFGVVCDDAFDVKRFTDKVRGILARGRRFKVIRLPTIPRNAMGKIPRPLIAQQLAGLYRGQGSNAANA